MTTALKIALDRGFTVTSPNKSEQGQLNQISFTLDLDSHYGEIENFVEEFPGNYVDIDEAIEEVMTSVNEDDKGYKLRETHDDKQLVFTIDVHGEESNPSELVDTMIERFCLDLRDKVISEIECDDDVPVEDIYESQVERMHGSWAWKFNYDYEHKTQPPEVEAGQSLTVILEAEAFENELSGALDGVHTHMMPDDVMQAVCDARYPQLSFKYDEDQKEVRATFKSDLKTPIGTQAVLSNIESKVNHALTKELSDIDKSLVKHFASNEVAPSL